MSATEGQIGVNTNLQKQDLKNLDISNLSALSPEVISRQATINIGTIGHVAHGKSTVVKAISGVQTVRFKNELERNITIKLERISYEKLLQISKSPELLRKYIERQEQQRKKGFFRQPSKLPLWGETALHRDYYDEVFRICSPSSGYESAIDTVCSTPISFTHFTLPRWKSFPSPISISASSLTKTKKTEPSTSTRRIEYVVQAILSIEAIQSQPIFFVKWKNYPESQNTWEPLENLKDCRLLLKGFIEEQFTKYEATIARLNNEIEATISENHLVLAADNTAQILRQLDEFDYLSHLADFVLLAQFRLSGSKSKAQPLQIRKRIINAFLLKPYKKLRRQQLYELAEWREKVNSVETENTINVENLVDFDVLDKSFVYIKESFAGDGIHVVEEPPIGCKCAEECNARSKCCPKMADEYFAYDKNGRLRIKPGGAIYECNSLCLCGPDCPNRVIQRGRSNSLCLFKTSNGCGWGLRTDKPIRKGEFVCEYVGEIITADEADVRGKRYDAIGRTYLFDLDYNTSAESVYTVDAAVYGNVSHFINHSCDPNLAVFPFWINCLDLNLPRLAFFSLRPIKAGEELTFDYIRSVDTASTYENLSDAEKVACRCGAENCRKVLF